MKGHNPLLGDIDQFTAQNIKLAYAVANKYKWVAKMYNLEEDDITAMALTGFVKGYLTYNGSTKPSTYIYACCMNEIRRYHTYMNHGVRKGPIPISLETKVRRLNKDETLTLMDALVYEEDWSNVIVDDALNRLDSREREIAGLLCSGMNGEEVASLFGVPGFSIRKMKQNIRAKIKWVAK